MKIDFNEYYTIGTVVSLQKHPKKVMIIGIAQMHLEEGKFYDYMGVIFPEGYVGPASCILFNKSDINQVFFEPPRAEETNFYTHAMNRMAEIVDQVVNEKSCG